MKALLAFAKKECMEATRTGKVTVLVLFSVVFGIMNPGIAKMMPWMMEMLSDTMAEGGLVVTDIRVDAMTSWTQFFKNIPVVLIVFVLLFSDIFTREYRTGTLMLMLTKGLSRYKVVISKTVLLLALWTACYGICFAITYGYNGYFWDNRIMKNLFFAAIIWWVFGVWIICGIVLFSTLLKNNTGVILCTGMTVLLAYLLSVVPKVKEYSPAILMNTASLLAGEGETGAYIKAICIAVSLCVICVAASIQIINKRQM